MDSQSIWGRIIMTITTRNFKENFTQESKIVYTFSKKALSEMTEPFFVEYYYLKFSGVSHGKNRVKFKLFQVVLLFFHHTCTNNFDEGEYRKFFRKKKTLISL
jgi:hypothetical protein